MKTASITGKPLDALRSVHDRMGQAERVLAIARELDATFLIHPVKTEDFFMDSGDYPQRGEYRCRTTTSTIHLGQ